jgi:hypothetical protein
MMRSSWSISRVTSCWILAFFFLRRLLGRFDWTQATDLPIHVDQAVGQAQELAVFIDLVLGFSDGCGGRQALRNGVAIDFLGELEMRPMARVLGLSAMAGGFPTLASGA